MLAEGRKEESRERKSLKLDLQKENDKNSSVSRFFKPIIQCSSTCTACTDPDKPQIGSNNTNQIDKHEKIVGFQQNLVISYTS